MRAPGCKNRPASFPGLMSCKATKPGPACVLYLIICICFVHKLSRGYRKCTYVPGMSGSYWYIYCCVLFDCIWANKMMMMICFTLYCCLLGPLLYIVSFRCYVFWRLVVLVKLSVLVKWLARKTPLRKPNRGQGIDSRKPRPKRAYDFLILLYCFIVLLCICVVSRPYVIYFHTR